MTNDETILFKQFQQMKDDAPNQKYRGVFHTAFDDPTMPKGAELR